MKSTPSEIVGQISSFLSIGDLKSFRLCCKAFAEICQTRLFSDFDFRLWPSSHRLYQLEQLSANPEIASKLKCLCFESGIQLEYADYRYWQANVYHDISSEWERTHLATKGTRDSEYSKFHTNLQARFTPDLANRFKLYKWHLDQEAALMAEMSSVKTMAKSIGTLKQHSNNLRFKLVMKEPQITLEDLEHFDASMFQHEHPEDPDPRRRVFKRREHCLLHFINFLKGACLSGCDIGYLSALQIPHELFTEANASSVFDNTFRSLRTLDIQIGSLPHSDWLSRSGLHPIYNQGRDLAARRFRALLNRSANLTNLRIEFPESKEAEYSFELFDRTNLDRFPRFFVPHLKTFELCRFRCRWGELKCFLEEAKSLSSLKLAYCRLETGSMIDLLHFIPQMKLQSVAIMGRWYVEEDSGEWHAHNADDFTADCFASTSYEGPYVRDGMKARVEQFMLEGGECPLPTWTAQGREEDIWEMKGDTSWHFLPGLPRQF